MKTTTFIALEIECQGCASAIKKSVGTVAGVSDVQVDVDAKRVTVSHDEATSADVIKAAVEKAGFSAQSC
ncbi:heavy metal-associated domain-containing protein [Armatimonas sp.]|uniref:heavy-metal-associated domain-containing protein n=1 Tax=Armatimonas sp. TaxID=1872638 RepID=UPI00286AC353|nr:heavy metal-associated domain-containing protein [Armatimonas sp.]